MNMGRDITTVRRRRKTGFSMAEVLIVVAILTILSGIVGVSAVSMYRNMKQTQLDKTAETIFHAAQDRLSEIYAYGREETIEFDPGATDNIINASKKHFIVTSDDVGTNPYKEIMGDDTVSSEILNNFWAIEYQASSCRVLNVVYADNSGQGLGSFGGGINAAPSLSTMLADLKNHSFNDRKNKYGWFGDATLTDLQNQEKQVGNTSVDVEIINEENLYAHVRVSVGWEDNLTKSEASKFLEHQKVIITIKDADDTSSSAAHKDFEISGKDLLSKGTIESDPDGFYNGRSDADAGDDYVTDRYLTASWDMLLDSLSAGAFTGSNAKKTFEGYSTGITSGNNFYFIAKLVSDDGSTPEVQDYDIDNSKFASYSVSTGKAYIEYGRHLQNAGMAQLADLNAVQIADIDFDSEVPAESSGDLDETNKYWRSVYRDGDDGYTAYQPFNSSYLDSYDGQNHVIKNLDINKVAEGSTNAGIFGDLSSCTSVKNVIITDSKVNAPGASAAGMFAAKFSGTSALTVENCYLGNISVDASSSASVGGFAGEIAHVANVSDFASLKANVGSTVAATNAGAFAGRITGVFTGNKLYAFGGKIAASSNAGGLVGYSDAALANLTLSGCKISGTEVTSSTGNAGAIAGYVQNQNGTFTINSDTVVAGSIVRSNTGNAGGFVGSSDSVLNITDSMYYMPDSGEATRTAGKVSMEFAKAVGLTPSSDGAVTYGNLSDAADFKYLNELKTSNISGMQWISGSSNAGGLVGVSTKDVLVTNTSASGVLAAPGGNGGGFVGNTSGKLTVTGSYSDFYISGKRAGGFAAGCAGNSTFTSCYSAGFLVGTADIAAGFAPVDVGTVTDSYTVFNFDNVTDTALFTGTAEEDEDHKLNENGTVSNYPSVHTHSYYPVAKSNSGKAYYVYSETDFEANDNAVCVRASELAENKNEDGETLLTGSLVKSQGRNNTTPYSLSPFFGSILKDYPFPTLKVTKTVDGATSETVLKHYNDWLIIDGEGDLDIEIWYMMYDENLKELKKDVSGFNGSGTRFARNTKAVPVEKQSGKNEYQINVGKHSTFSGFKFVGYFDPDTASKLQTTSFDRSKKLDYLDKNDKDEKGNAIILASVSSSMGSGDRVVQTSINETNTFGKKCASHESIFRENADGKKILYAVYRDNKPYTVKLTYRQYNLPKDNTVDTETKTLREINEATEIATSDEFKVVYSEPEDAYKIIYGETTEAGKRVAASHRKLSHDEEYIEDYLGDEILKDDAAALKALNDLRGEKNQLITRTVRDFSKAGFEFLDLDKLQQAGYISETYVSNVRAKKVSSIIRIDPDVKDSSVDITRYTDGCTPITPVKKNNTYEFTMNTHKSFEYVVLYNSNNINKTLYLVFRNTAPDSTVREYSNYRSFNGTTLPGRNFAASTDTDTDTEYKVKVGSTGFPDLGDKGKLVTMMDPNSPPEFDGFTYNFAASQYPTSSSNTATLYYDRNKYSISFNLNGEDEDPDAPFEKYDNSTSRRDVQGVYYKQDFKGYLWEQLNSKYRFNRSGYKLKGFKYTYKDKNGSYVTPIETTSENTACIMPNSNVTVEPLWEPNPSKLRVEVYYQSQYDDISAEDADKTYEFYAATECNVVNGVATTRKNVKINIDDLINSSNLINDLQPRLKDGSFDKSDEHDLSNGGFNPFVGNTANTQAKGYPRISYNDTMVVSLYYDRKEMEFDFHFITKPNTKVPGSNNYYISTKYGTIHVDEYTVHHEGYYSYSVWPPYITWHDPWDEVIAAHDETGYLSEWDAIKATEWYDYTGNKESRQALSEILKNKTTTPTAVGKYAKAWVTIQDHNAQSNTRTDYLGYYRNNNRDNYNYYSNSSSAQYGIIVHFTGLYGAPAVFSDDDSVSLIPAWHYKNSGVETNLQRYSVGGSRKNNGNYSFATEYELNYFKIITATTPTFNYNFYPLYPGSETAGEYRIFVEETPPSNKARASASDDVSETRFDLSKNPYITSIKVSKDEYTDFNNPDIFVDGYTVYKYREYNNKNAPGGFTTFDPQNPPSSPGNDRNYLDILLKRKEYILNFNDAELNATGSSIPTEYLFKQEIPRFPGETEITSPLGDDYEFAGWYTTSNYDVPIADKNGNILDLTKGSNTPENIDEYGDVTSYLNLPSTQSYTTTEGSTTIKHLLMGPENMEVFAKWLPKKFNVDFDPFYPKADSHGVVDSLRVKTAYKSTIGVLPTLENPTGYDNYSIEEEDGVTYCVISEDDGTVIAKYKFLGWYKYNGDGEPSQMSDLEIPFVADETEVIGDTVLYAKWEQMEGRVTYQIICYEIETGDVIFAVERYGNFGENITINPPTMDDDTSNDKEVLEGYSYDDLYKYQATSQSITYPKLTDGLTFEFRYEELPRWKYIVKSCINVTDGATEKQIVIKSITEDDVRVAQAQVYPENIEGYSVYEYQIIGGESGSLNDTSDNIPVPRPSLDNMETPVEIIIRYRHDGIGIAAKADAVDYYKYDPIDFSVVTGEFDWQDDTYAPAILYKVGDNVLAHEFLGGVEETVLNESKASAAKSLSEGITDSATVTMQLVAMNKGDSNSYIVLKQLVQDEETGNWSEGEVLQAQTVVTVKNSANYLRFTSTTGSGQIYYALDGSNKDNWYWDKELTCKIGPDGTSIVSADISGLPGEIKTNAETVKSIITATYNETTGKYKEFVIIKGVAPETKVYTMVNEQGNLANGHELISGNNTAYAVGTSEEADAVDIDLYDANGNKTGTITVIMPTAP
ncbi:MAG: type II secretion system protein [Butyrivibrio sp.]|nr:type II secretion system protein [Butyrivibrio sp.]